MKRNTIYTKHKRKKEFNKKKKLEAPSFFMQKKRG